MIFALFLWLPTIIHANNDEKSKGDSGVSIEESVYGVKYASDCEGKIFLLVFV